MTDPGAPKLHRGMSRRERRELLDALSTRAPVGAPSSPTVEAETPPPAPAATPAEAPADPPADAPTILMVCTGNICRSPMAEVVLRGRLGVSIPLRIHGAGTRALVGHEMTEQAQALAVELGAAPIDAAAHHARLLTEPLLKDANLVLAMSREHRTHIVQLSPGVLRRVFTVREFARLASTLSTEEAQAAANAAGDDPRERLRAVVGAVTAQRGVTAASNGEDDDVIDPYRRSQATYELSASQLSPALDEVARVIRAALG